MAKALEVECVAPDGMRIKTKYVQLKDDLYILAFKTPTPFADLGVVATELLKRRGLEYRQVRRFLAVRTRMDDPDRLMSGNARILRLYTAFRDDKIVVSGMRDELGDHAIWEIFRDEIYGPGSQ